MNHRAATEHDFDQVYDLYMDEQLNPYLTYDWMPKEKFHPLYEDLLQTGTLFVVEDGNGFLGTYRLIPKTYRQAHIIYLGSFGLKRTAQGRGLGTQILADIKQKALADGRKRIELTVDQRNLPAIGLYLKMGFVIEGVVRKNFFLRATSEYYDEYLMAILLD